MYIANNPVQTRKTIIYGAFNYDPEFQLYNYNFDVVEFKARITITSKDPLGTFDLFEKLFEWLKANQLNIETEQECIECKQKHMSKFYETAYCNECWKKMTSGENKLHYGI